MKSPARIDSATIARRFADADWTFGGAARRGGEFHPYPARFIPAIPAQILDLLEVEEGAVLDPFCGSGTTLAQARLRGLASAGVDINPVACLISRVRTRRWVQALEADVEAHARSIHSVALQETMLGEEFAEIPRLDHWFSVPAQRALSGAVRYLNSLSDEDPWKDILSVSVSAATVKISNQESDTRYAAVDKGGTQEEAAALLERSVRRTIEWLKKNTMDYPDDREALVLQRDARDLSPVEDESISAVCFSPPYPNAYEYWLYHKYRMYWLGFDAVKVRASEIGARPHYSKANGLNEHDFAAQMTEIFSELVRVCRPGAHTVVVVGDSVIGGRSIDNGALLTGVAESAGMETVFEGVRPIAAARSSFNRAHSRARSHEHILVYRKV